MKNNSQNYPLNEDDEGEKLEDRVDVKSTNKNINTWTCKNIVIKKLFGFYISKMLY